MRARLADIATHAGVSEATVSRVLNTKPGVSQSTRQAVLTARAAYGVRLPPELVVRGGTAAAPTPVPAGAPACR